MINIGARLRRLRMEKDIRINAMAERLGVDPHDIVGWESGEGYPPIELLPKIAVFFETTTDELLCMDSFSDDGYSKEITAEYRRLIADNHISQAADKMRAASRAHPRNWQFKVMLQYALYLLCDQPNMIRYYAQELKQLHDEIIAGCPDDSVRTESRRLYALHLWADLGAGEDAVNEVMKLPGRAECRENMLPLVTKGDEKRRLLRSNIFDSALDTARDIFDLADSGGQMSLIAAAEAVIKILGAAAPADDIGTISAPFCRAWLRLAEYYGSAGDRERSLDAFDSAVGMAEYFDSLPERYVHKSPLLYGVVRLKADMEPSPLTVYISDTVLRAAWAESLMYEPRMAQICERLGRAAQKVKAGLDADRTAREKRIIARAAEKSQKRPAAGDTVGNAEGYTEESGNE